MKNETNAIDHILYSTNLVLELHRSTLEPKNEILWNAFQSIETNFVEGTKPIPKSLHEQFFENMKKTALCIASNWEYFKSNTTLLIIN